MNKIILSFFLLSNFLNAQQITAHRGASHDAPQNTMPAFDLAWEQGADYIEADFYISKDKKIVCFHDSKTGKLANENVKVEESTWDKLKTLDVGYKKGKKWKGTRMPLLEEVLSSIPEGKGIFLEIKSGVAAVPFIKAIIDTADLKKSQIKLISFKKDVLKKCKELMPDIKTQLLLNLKVDKKTSKVNYTVDQLIEMLKAIKADAIATSCELSQINPENVAKLQDAGFKWNVWTVNDVKKAKHVKNAGVDFITTDKPALIKKGIRAN